MGSHQDFTMAPAHAHLNLVGWASLALMGTFYAITGKGGALGWLNFALSASAVVVMVPFLAVMLGGKPAAEGGVIVGSILAILGMLTFLFNVLSTWRQAEPA
jgi:Mg/Co/Ni transporter MgtE